VAAVRVVPARISAADRERLARAAARCSPSACIRRSRSSSSSPRRNTPAARKELAASKLPGGPRYYDILARQSTTTSMTADEIHQVGLAEVKRIRAEMEKVIASTGFKGSWDDFLKFTREDKRSSSTSPSSARCSTATSASAPTRSCPSSSPSCRACRMESARWTVTEGDNADHYSAGALDGSRAGYFDANVNNIHKRPTHEMEVDPAARRRSRASPADRARAGNPGPALFRRLGGYTAYSEGWALYAESLGLRNGHVQGSRTSTSARSRPRCCAPAAS
jgi:uncharacterized protein (DUF885 family)